MRLRVLSEDGAIEGWAVAFAQTVIVFTLIVLGFFISSVRESWKVMGPYVTTIFPLSFGSWLAYKAAVKIGAPQK